MKHRCLLYVNRAIVRSCIDLGQRRSYSAIIIYMHRFAPVTLRVPSCHADLLAAVESLRPA